MKSKFIYFDVAGTLLYKKRFIKQVQVVLKEFGISVSDELVRARHKIISETFSFPAKTSKSFYQAFNRKFLLAVGVIPKDEIVESIFNKCKFLPWEEFDDLGSLKAFGIPMGIISNWDKTLTDKVNTLGYNFKLVIGSGELGISKPDLKLYHYAVKQAKFKPGEIIYVGDSIKLDIVPALKVGLKAILIDRFDDFPGFQGERVNSLKDLSRYIR